jgi:hypothetical protein
MLAYRSYLHIHILLVFCQALKFSLMIFFNKIFFLISDRLVSYFPCSVSDVLHCRKVIPCFCCSLLCNYTNIFMRNFISFIRLYKIITFTIVRHNTGSNRSKSIGQVVILLLLTLLSVTRLLLTCLLTYSRT